MAVNNSNLTIEYLNKRFVKAVEAIIKLGMTKNDSSFCKSIGINRSSFAQYKSNHAKVSALAIYKAINIYGLSPGYFFLEEEEVFRKDSEAYNNHVYATLTENVLLSAPEAMKDEIKTLLEKTLKQKKEGESNPVEPKEVKQPVQPDFAELLVENNKAMKRLIGLMEKDKAKNPDASDPE